MAKINLVNEIMRHSDDEIIDYLYTLMSTVYRSYNNVEDPKWLLAVSGEIDQIYNVLRSLKSRNDSRKSENSLQ